MNLPYPKRQRSAVPPVVPPLPTTSRYLRPQDLRRFESLQFAAKIIVEGFYAGRHRSPYHDASAEFSDYRPYVPGDEIRSLDWRAYARSDRDYIKLFRKDTDLRCHILLDSSQSMGFTGSERAKTVATSDTSPLSKFEYAAYLTAALGYMMTRQGDKVSLGIGSDSLKTFVPPGGTMSHLHNLLLQVERTKPTGPTHLAHALRSLFGLARRRGLLVVLSDFLEEPEELFSALAMYSYRGWQILLFHVLTETELSLEGEEGPGRYRDTESDALLDADADSLREAYSSEIRTWLNSLETQCKARRIYYARTTTDTPCDLILERYLTTRSKV